MMIKSFVTGLYLLAALAAIAQPPAKPVANPQAAMQAFLNKKYMGKWQIANDASQHYDSFYVHEFIMPKQKEYKYYPYFAEGDYDGNGVKDWAAIVVNAKKGDVKIAVVLNGQKAYFIDEQGAISTFPKKKILSSPWAKKKVAMKGDGIMNEYFEKSASVYYWTGKGFSNIFISD